ncbi:hypothetical protein [Companilactobacillus muriivasis]|uniref:hypothetical protein n=1 Tax=Companilactobacillus muriivasis TaxID=3081444 RepID=UPI0030C7080C
MARKSDVYERSKFLHQICVIPKRQIINWSFYCSITIVIIYSYFVFKNNVYRIRFFSFMNNNSMSFFSIAVSAISMIVAAIAIIIIIYNKKDLHLIINGDNHTFEGFIFPYKWGSVIWGVLATISLLSNLMSLKVNNFVKDLYYLFWMFLLLYCTFYMIYIINEVVQHVMLSAKLEDK